MTTTPHLLSPDELLRQHDADAFRHSLGDDLPQFLALVAEVCDSPIAAVTLIGSREVRVIAAYGMTVPQSWPLDDSLHDILAASDRTIVVADAAGGDLIGAGFAAAAPLHYDGKVVGALCVFDATPHPDGSSPVMRKLTGLAHRLDVEASLRRVAPFTAVAELHEDVITAVTHEIRTPLAVIQGHLELLGDRPEVQDAAYRWQIGTVTRNVHRLCRAVDHLLLTTGRPDEATSARNQ